MKCQFILDKKFRQGRRFKLVEWNQLHPSQKQLLSGLYDEAEVYGLFEPINQTQALTYKVAYREVAMLFLHLQHFEKLPHYFIAAGTHNITGTLIRLVLDEIIEIESETGYMAGAMAVPVIYGEDIFEENYLPDHLSKLSVSAMYYAWMLWETNLQSVAAKLYAYNSLPWDGPMKARFNKTNTVEAFLFSRITEEEQKILDEHWNLNSIIQRRSWLSWSKKSIKEDLPLSSTFTCKLYISSLIYDLPEVFKRFIPVISSSSAFSFKIGDSIEGLLRPDKMVAYFYTKESLLNTAALLEESLGSYPPQGVPFTMQLDKSGLLSYGEDPPQSEVLKSIDGGSWRASLTDQIALAMNQARSDKLDWQQSIRFIHAMLQTTGVNSHTWAPVK